MLYYIIDVSYLFLRAAGIVLELFIQILDYFENFPNSTRGLYNIIIIITYCYYIIV